MWGWIPGFLYADPRPGLFQEVNIHWILKKVQLICTECKNQVIVPKPSKMCLHPAFVYLVPGHPFFIKAVIKFHPVPRCCMEKAFLPLEKRWKRRGVGGGGGAYFR